MSTVVFAEDTKKNHLVEIDVPISRGEQAPDFLHIIEEDGWKHFENVGNLDYFVLATRTAKTTTDKELFGLLTFVEGDLKVRWYEEYATYVQAATTEITFQNEMSK